MMYRYILNSEATRTPLCKRRGGDEDTDEDRSAEIDGSGDQVGKTGHDFPEILFLEIIGQFKKSLRISTALTERNLSTNFFLILSIFSKFRF